MPFIEWSTSCLGNMCCTRGIKNRSYTLGWSKLYKEKNIFYMSCSHPLKLSYATIELLCENISQFHQHLGGATTPSIFVALILNGLYKKKLQFSSYWNETCFIEFLSSRQLIWAIVEPESPKSKVARPFWKYVHFPHFDQKVDFLWLQ